MKSFAFFAAAMTLAMGACSPTGSPPAPSGGSAGAEGDAYCETVPANPDDLADWNQICQPGGRR